MYKRQVQMGYNELVSHEDTDSSTQYYLIVLSDGGFMDDATNQITIDTGTVQGPVSYTHLADP